MDKDQNDNKNDNNMFFRNLILWLVIAVMIGAVFNVFGQERQNSGGASAQSVVAYSDFINEVDKKQVSDVAISGETLRGHYADGRAFVTYIPGGTDVVSKIEDKGVRISGVPEKEQSYLGSLFMNILLPVILMAAVWIFVLRQMQGGSNKAMGFGRSKAKLLGEKLGRITFADVA